LDNLHICSSVSTLAVARLLAATQSRHKPLCVRRFVFTVTALYQHTSPSRHSRPPAPTGPSVQSPPLLVRPPHRLHTPHSIDTPAPNTALGTSQPCRQPGVSVPAQVPAAENARVWHRKPHVCTARLPRAAAALVRRRVPRVALAKLRQRSGRRVAAERRGGWQQWRRRYL
jgi:hypothetical protein